MNENQKRQFRSMLFASLFWLIGITCFLYLISLFTFTLFDEKTNELGTFRLKNGRTFELNSYQGNAISSAELHLKEITNKDSDNYCVIQNNKPYDEFVYWRQINDSLIWLVLKNEKEKDTIYMMIQNGEISLSYQPEFFHTISTD